MKKLALLFLVFSVASNAQSPSNFKEISLIDEKATAKQAPFFVDRVYDGRQFKENIGTVQTGAFNSNAFAKTKKPLQDELMDYLTAVYPKSDGKTPISINISEMFVSELTESFSETGYASVVIDVIETIDGKPYIVGRYSENEEGKGMDVTRKHDERLRSCVNKCLKAYLETSEKRKERVEFIAEPVVSSHVPSKFSKGIYYNYSDVLNGIPQDTMNFYLTGTPSKKYLTHKVSGYVLQHFYAVSDGKDLYVNVSKYAKDRCYSKVEVIGNKFFVEDVIVNKKTSVMWGAMFGIVGMMIAEASAETDASSPMLIDIITGKPMFLTNAALKKMLQPYPEVLKEYKKSRMTSLDKKTAVKKVLISSQRI